MNDDSTMPCDNCGNPESVRAEATECTGKTIIFNVCSNDCAQNLMFSRICSAGPDEQGYF